MVNMSLLCDHPLSAQVRVTDSIENTLHRNSETSVNPIVLPQLDVHYLNEQ